ncbi:hypothetical protein F980_02236, partial [Acinetobacter lwoffii NIPH 715]
SFLDLPERAGHVIVFTSIPLFFLSGAAWPHAAMPTWMQVVGEILPSTQIVQTFIQDQMWVSLNIREDQYAPFQKMSSIEGYIPALDKTATFKIKQISAEGEFATIKTTRQTGGYDVRSFKLHLVPAPAIPELKVGMSVLFKLKETR